MTDYATHIERDEQGQAVRPEDLRVREFPS